MSTYRYDTPQQLFHSIDDALLIEERHKIWLGKIRAVVSECIISEEERVPSQTSLWRHWMRTSFICCMWENSHLSDINTCLPNPEHSGWLLKDGDYVIDWEDFTQEQRIKKGCTTSWSGCKKRSMSCGPGCMCIGCMNLPQMEAEKESDTDEDDTSTDDISTDDERIETELVTDTDYFIPNNNV
jgi:hypothetical protein